MKTGATSASWNTFATGGYADPSVVKVNAAAGNGLADMTANCKDA